MRLILSALASLTLLALAACASPITYQPAEGARGFGYSDVRIEEDRYRVSFRGPGGADGQTVEDYALLRAADLALAQGYEWFEVLDRRAVSGSGGGPRPSGGVGISAGSGGYSGVGVGLGISLGGGSPASSTVEVRLGRGPKPPAAYDAARFAAEARTRLDAAPR